MLSRAVSSAAEILAIAGAVGRILLGLAPFFAVRPAIRLFGIPEVHDTATTRLFARLFGVRDAGLGVMIAATLDQPVLLAQVVWLNLATDLADAVAILIPIARRDEIAGAATKFLAFALIGAGTWVVLLALLRAGPG